MAGALGLGPGGSAGRSYDDRDAPLRDAAVGAPRAVHADQGDRRRCAVKLRGHGKGRKLFKCLGGCQYVAYECCQCLRRVQKTARGRMHCLPFDTADVGSRTRRLAFAFAFVIPHLITTCIAGILRRMQPRCQRYRGGLPRPVHIISRPRPARHHVHRRRVHGCGGQRVELRQSGVRGAILDVRARPAPTRRCLRRCLTTTSQNSLRNRILVCALVPIGLGGEVKPAAGELQYIALLRRQLGIGRIVAHVRVVHSIRHVLV